MHEFDFDLFLSHNSKDKPAVVQLRDLLKLRGISGWMDKEQLPPGQNWIPLIRKGLDNSRAIAVCVGGQGVGPWQDQEIQEALQSAVKDQRPIIPIFLPSAKGVDVTFPDFISLRSYVDFRDGFTQEALDDLVFGITGKRPQHAEQERRLVRLPQQFHFYGREKELATIREALDPNRRTWGVLIDGKGGIGKTALAIRAAYTAPVEWFQRICFVSAKTHELTPQGEQARTQFATPTWRDMLTDLAGEMNLREAAQRTEDEKLAALLERTLREQPTLIVFDNLESLPQRDLELLYEFLGVLPMGCKAIVTSRRRSDLDVRTLRLERLELSAALKVIASLAEDRPALRRATDAERLSLYEETGGNPLLIRWVVGQLGRGKCHDMATALTLLKKAPLSKDNDPLQFIMGDLVNEFTDSEVKVVTALTHFTQPTQVRHVAQVAGLSLTATQIALEDLSFRALVNPSLDYQRFVLAPLVGDYLRRVKPELVKESGERLASTVYEMISEKGYTKYQCFEELELEWDLIESSLPLFATKDNECLQTVCNALRTFFEFNGHWETRLGLSLKAEDVALQAGDYLHAGWRAYDAAWIFRLMGDASGVLRCAERALLHFTIGKNAGPNEIRGQGNAIRLKGVAHMMMGDYTAAESFYDSALKMRRLNGGDNAEIAVVLNDLAIARHLRKDVLGAKEAAEEAVTCSKASQRPESLATSTGTLAEIVLSQGDFLKAESLTQEALKLGMLVGRKQLVAANHRRLAGIYFYQHKYELAIAHARQSLAIYRDDVPDSPDFKNSETVLRAAQLELSLLKHPLGWTFNSNALEGNTLTLEEVERVLADPQAEIFGKRREELTETRNHVEALRQMADLIKTGRDFTTEDLFSLHTTLMQGTVVDIYKPVGKWKVESNETVVKLNGKRTINSNYARPENVAQLMNVWLDELNRRMRSRTTPIEDYVWLHATFARIHPFADGNGRLARLLANVPVYTKAHDPIIISARTRERYLESLARWQIACGPPLPSGCLFDKSELLNDFRLLCEEAMNEKF